MRKLWFSERAMLPRRVSRSEPPEEQLQPVHQHQPEPDEEPVEFQVRADLLPAPLREESTPPSSDPTIPPYADFLRFTQVPEVPRRLAGAQEMRGKSWPRAAPEEICSGTTHIAISPVANVMLPGTVFAKVHKFRVVTFAEPDLQNGRGCDEQGNPESFEDEEGTVRFEKLSSKVEFGVRLKNLYKFETKISNDEDGVLSKLKPVVCGACNCTVEAYLLPDLRHKYDFTFNHTVHVHGPAGVDFESKIRLNDKSRIDVVGVKICPAERGKSIPEIIRLLQATHFIRVLISVATPQPSAVMPRPLPPELREPQQLVLSEDSFDRSENEYEDREEEAASYLSTPPPPPEPQTSFSPYPRRPSRSEPG